MSWRSLKTWPDPFEAVRTDRKRFEFREEPASRPYRVGERIVLNEYDPNRQRYTGRYALCEITYVLRGPAFGVPEGYCCLSIDRQATVYGQ